MTATKSRPKAQRTATKTSTVCDLGKHRFLKPCECDWALHIVWGCQSLGKATFEAGRAWDSDQWLEIRLGSGSE